MFVAFFAGFLVGGVVMLLIIWDDNRSSDNQGVATKEGQDE